MESRYKVNLTEEQNIQLDLYIDLLIGKNLNHYKKVTKAIADSFDETVQDVVREIFKRTEIERNIVVGRK